MPSRILIVQTAFLGDLVLSLPLLNAVSSLWPEARIDVITRASYRDVVAAHPAVYQAIPFDKRKSERGLAGLLRLARSLRSERYDLALLPHRSLRSALLVWLAGIPRRVGYANVPGSLFYTDRVLRDLDQHEGARVLSLLNALEPGLAARFDPRPQIEMRESPARAEVESWMDREGLPRDRRLIALAPGSVWATKRWPAQHWAALLKLLRQDRSLVPVIVGGPEDRDLSLRVRDAAGSEGYVAAGELSVAGSAELIRRCDLLITGDTGPLHLAQAVRTSTLAIFGPTVPEFGFAPTGPNDRIIGLDLPCRPCAIHGSRDCPLGHHHCMRWLSAGQVHSAARDLLQTDPA